MKTLGTLDYSISYPYWTELWITIIPRKRYTFTVLHVLLETPGDMYKRCAVALVLIDWAPIGPRKEEIREQKGFRRSVEVLSDTTIDAHVYS